MNAISFTMRLVAVLPLLQPTCRKQPAEFLFFIRLCTSLFTQMSIDVDPSAEDGTIFFFSPSPSPSLSQTIPLDNLQRSSSAFSTLFFFVCPARSKLRMPGHGLPFPARYPGGCLTDFWGVTFLFSLFLCDNCCIAGLRFLLIDALGVWGRKGGESLV